MDCDERLIGLLALALALCLPAAASSSPPWVSRIRRDHPRLFFNRETWPAVRARAMGAERDWYGWLKGRVEGCPADPPEKEWGTEAAAAAFVWLMTRDRKHLDKATRLLRASIAWYDECTRSGRSVNWYSSTRINAWAALDWLWNDLPPEERRKLGASFLEHVGKVQPGSGSRLAPRWNKSGPETGFYGTPSLLWYSGLVLHGEAIDDARAGEFLVRGHDLYRELLAHRSRCAGDDGGSASASLNYCLGAYPWAEHNFFWSWLSATGEEIAPAWPYVASLTDYIFWNRLPGGREFGSGDAYHLNNRIGTTHLYVHFSNIMHFYAQTEPRRAALARWMRDAWTRPSRGTQWTWPVQPFLRTRTERCPSLAPPQSLPLARHFENMGQLFMRSGSGEADTYLMLTSGGLVRSHKQFDNNHFALYHRGFLALDTGTRPEPGQHLSHYYCRTVAHNCVTIRTPDEKLPRYWGGRAPGEEALPVPNDGGQLKPLGSKVVAFETNDAFAYVASDATEAYGGKCSLCLRQIVFVPPAHVVIFDRVTAANAAYEKRWLFHTAAEPAIEADAFRAEHEEGRVYCRTLLPQDAQLSKIGGPGRQFWSDGRNWPLPKGWRRNVTGEEPLLGQWRVEVRPRAPRKADAFLHLIELGDSNRPAQMAAHRLIADRNSPGVAFDAPGGRKVEVRFGLDGPASGHIRISGGGPKIDREMTRTVQKQAGLTGVPADEPEREPHKRAPPLTSAEPPRPVDPLASYTEELARARQDAEAGRYERAAEAVERSAASEKTKAAKDALARVARGFRAVSRLRRWIIEGVKGGRHARVYVEIAGRAMRGTLASADESGVRVRVAGSEVPLRWDEVPPRRLLAMAKKYAPEDGQPLLDDFAFATDIRARRR